MKGDALSPAPLGTDIHKGDILEYFFDFANWTYGRVYKDVSRTGVAICE